LLIEAIINTVTAHDLLEYHRVSHGSSTLDILNGPMLQRTVSAINDCGVQFRIWKNRDNTQHLKWTSLLGDDKLKLLKLFPDKLHACHPTNMQFEVQDLWKVHSYFSQYYS